MTAEFNSQALIIARESRGKTQADVADAAGVKQGTISKAENDLQPPSTEQIEKIAEYLGFPVEFFAEPGQLRDGTSICHYHRKRKTLPAKVLNKVNATMFVRNVGIQHLLRGIEIETPRTFHTLDLDEFGTPTAVAKALRGAWRIPLGPIPNMTQLIESAGAVVILSPFGHRKLFGMSCWPTQSNPLFYMNSEISMADLRWTMAHELGHLTMHGSPTSGDPEDEADEFAAEFITPAAQIAPELRGLKFHSLGALKQEWRVSMKTLIRRAADLGVIAPGDATRLYKQHSWYGYNAAEPYDAPPEHPTLLEQAARVHLAEHEYTEAELRRVTRHTNDDDFRELTSVQSRGRLSVVRR